MSDSDARIAAVLPTHDETQPPLPKTIKRSSVNVSEIANLRKILAQMFGGQDLTQLPALTHHDVLKIVSKVGDELGI